MKSPANHTEPGKQQLRQHLREIRQGLSGAALEKRSAAIGRKLLRLPEIRRAQVVHAYWPLLHLNEVDTRHVIARLVRQGRKVVLPTMPGENLEDMEPALQHAVFVGEEYLQQNRWGIHEPAGGECVPAECIDVVLVPALGVSRSGHRIGYGGGFYDRLLASTAAVSVALVYADCFDVEVPAEAHDQPVQIVVTEQEVFRVAT